MIKTVKKEGDSLMFYINGKPEDQVEIPTINDFNAVLTIEVEHISKNSVCLVLDIPEGCLVKYK
jgi:hypothetical protein